MITWITENVAVGEYSDACNRKNLVREKIDCVLSLRIMHDIEEPILCDQMGIHYYHIAVGRHQGLEPIKIELRTAAYMLKLLVKKYEKILVHCTSGIDRAPFVVAYWIVRYNGKDICENKEDLKFWISAVYRLIKEKRPQIMEHYEWV